jgi:ergothioneine biosynthesis protein EgtB
LLTEGEGAGPAGLTPHWRKVREYSLALAAPLSAEDQGLQSMPDASPTKWHLAHTSWFFETLVLRPHLPGYRPFHARYGELFNSYYESLGPRHARPLRGLLSRPALSEVLAYRRHVDEGLAALAGQGDLAPNAAALLELGLHHEQQHQELLLTDILHAFSLNPWLPAVRPEGYANAIAACASGEQDASTGWKAYPGGSCPIGHGGPGFAFDNEGPAHTVQLAPYALAKRLVTQGEFQAFIDDGGYREPRWWLSDGWAQVQTQGWQAPLYWLPEGMHFTLWGVQPRAPAAPVRHLSFFEAAAYAEWAGARLPTEFEWEAAMRSAAPPAQAFGSAWQWTRSSYDPYPRFRPPAGAVGEYNGKFMVGQIVLRGSSSATPEGHARVSYRNFFPPNARWQFNGLRLAQDR